MRPALMSVQQIRDELQKQPHDSEDALVLETELRMRAPRTGAVARLYGIPFPNAEQMEQVGWLLCALPPVEG